MDTILSLPEWAAWIGAFAAVGGWWWWAFRDARRSDAARKR